MQMVIPSRWNSYLALMYKDRQYKQRSYTIRKFCAFDASNTSFEGIHIVAVVLNSSGSVTRLEFFVVAADELRSIISLLLISDSSRWIILW